MEGELIGGRGRNANRGRWMKIEKGVEGRRGNGRESRVE